VASVSRARRRRADALEIAAVAVVVATAGFFLAHGGGHDLASGPAAGRLVALGRLTGLLGTALLLLQLLLAGRLPWVDRTYGHDRALVAHRHLSRVALPLLLAHAGAITVGYAAQDGLSPLVGWLVEPVRLLSGAVPDMLTAFAAMGLLVVVAVTSVAAARRRLSREAWHVVHLTGYAAVALSVPHQLSAGSDIAGHPVTRLFWLALYIATAGAVLVFRFLLPLVRSLRHTLTVEEVVHEAPGVVSLHLRGRALHRLPVRAGQFLQWRFLTPGLWAAAHPWSISAAPDGQHLRITVRDLGDHSRRLLNVRPGTRVVIEGPYGAFTAERRTRRRVLLIAAGIGITPIRALAEELLADSDTPPGDISVLYRGAQMETMVFRCELERMSTDAGLRLLMLTGPSGRGSWLPLQHAAWGRDDDAAALHHLVPGLRDHDVYVCGPAAWMDLVESALRAAGVPAAQIHDERFTA